MKEVKKKFRFETQCGASWQVSTDGSKYIIKCRICKTIVASGGTPKCLKDGK